MKTNELNYNQKVAVLSMIQAIESGHLSKYSIVSVVSRLFNISLSDASEIISEMKENHRLVDSEVYYFDGENLFLNNGDRQILVSQTFIDSCSPLKQKLLRFIQSTFK